MKSKYYGPIFGAKQVEYVEIEAKIESFRIEVSAFEQAEKLIIGLIKILNKGSIKEFLGQMVQCQMYKYRFLKTLCQDCQIQKSL